MSDRILKAEMIHKFAETVGVEKAAELIEEASHQSGLASQSDFGKAEALKILNRLRERGGMIGIIAGFLASEVHLMNE